MVFIFEIIWIDSIKGLLVKYRGLFRDFVTDGCFIVRVIKFCE